MGLFYFLTLGWVWRRGNQLAQSDKMSIVALRWYIRLVCPVLMTAVFINVALK